jgi:phage terminase Nu1 subunit (DNA packaging protein)
MQKFPTYTATGSAEVTGRDRRTMARILRDVKPDVRGKYSIKTIMAAASAYDKRRVPAKANTSGAPTATERLKAAQAELVENKNARANGELLVASEVEAEWSNILRSVRAGMLALPSRVQQRCPGIAANIVREIANEVTAVLTALGKEEDQSK